VPYTYGASLTVSHDLLPATGTNIGGASIALASSYNDPAARERSLAFSSGQILNGYNFGLVRPSAFKPDQSGQTTSPGTITYSHLYQPGTMGTVNFAESGGEFNYEIRLDANCNGSFDGGETWQAAPSLSVDAAWPRESDGSFKTCAVEVRVGVPAGLPANTVDIARIASALSWANNTGVVNQNQVTDTTTVLQGGVLQINKEVRNLTQGTAFVASNQAKPGDVLEYRISYKNIGSQPLFEVELSDPVPFYSDLEQNVYTGSSEVELHCPDASVVNIETGAASSIQLDLIAQCVLSTAAHPSGSGSAEALQPGQGGYFLYRVKVR
jgi:uncharacterized repeat protein (TIGR01451 family)